MNKIKFLLSVLLVATVLRSPHSYAVFYKCVDQAGNIEYSDVKCEGGEEILNDVAINADGLKREDGSPLVIPQPGGQVEAIALMNQQAIDNCLQYLIESSRFPDPDPASIIVKSHSFSWVAVEMVGSRKMLSLVVNAKNSYGAYDGFSTVECLLMGDNVSINKGEYTILD